MLYFDGPALRAVPLDTLEDRELYRVPGSTQHSHGHPVFSLDDRWVLYNSMIGPAHNVYMADVHSLASMCYLWLALACRIEIFAWTNAVEMPRQATPGTAIR